MVKRYWLLLVGVGFILSALALLSSWIRRAMVSDLSLAFDAGNPLARLAFSALAVVVLLSLGVWAISYHYRRPN